MEVSKTVLEARELYRFYHVGEEETLALKGVSVSLSRGEFVAIRGPSGSGKSTLLACIAGLDEPDGGHVDILGRRMTRKSESRRAALRAREIGMLLQSGNLLEHLTVSDNVALRLRLAGRPRSTYIDDLFERLEIEHVARSRLARISGGEAARAGLALAMSAKPALLIADEPTGEVDADTELKILDLLDDYRRDGRAVLVVTHSDAVARRADRTIDLYDGRILNA